MVIVRVMVMVRVRARVSIRVRISVWVRIVRVRLWVSVWSIIKVAVPFRVTDSHPQRGP